jgi:hypothetical protein
MCLWRAFLPLVFSVHSSWITCLFILFPSVLYKCGVGVQIGHWRVWCPVTWRLWLTYIGPMSIMFKQLLFNMSVSIGNVALLMCNHHKTWAGIWCPMQGLLLVQLVNFGLACCKPVLVARSPIPLCQHGFSTHWLHLHSCEVFVQKHDCSMYFLHSTLLNLTSSSFL